MSSDFELNNSDFEEDRYSRLRLIPWWDQDRLKNATIMVVGAGAIGNELIKNLTLLGIGRILIYDMDAQTVEKVQRKLGFFAIIWYNIVGDENAGRKENGEQPQRWRNRQLE